MTTDDELWSKIRTTATWFEYIDGQPFQFTDITTTSGDILRYRRHAPDHQASDVLTIFKELSDATH